MSRRLISMSELPDYVIESFDTMMSELRNAPTRGGADALEKELRSYAYSYEAKGYNMRPLYQRIVKEYDDRWGNMR